MSTASSEASTESLRDGMIAEITNAGYTLTPKVERALRTVERHVFVPDAAPEDAYANNIVVTKRDTDGQVLSCVSAPTVVALQLGQLDVRPGHRVLEIGAGTGYNAALLAHLTGPGGHVTAIDVDTDIVDHARDRLDAAEVRNAEVVLGDGALGHPAGAPYDRIIATVGAYEIPAPWLDQLTPGGRLVVPMRLRGSISRSIAFEHDGGRWRSVDHQMCGFIPLRGIGDDPRRKIPLTTDQTVILQLNQEHTIDPAGLMEIFDRPRHEAWTGVTYGPMQSVEGLYLWLTCVLATGLCSMRVDQTAVDAGLVQPMFGWGAMAVPADDGIAYLTWRTIGHTEDGGKIVEVGVIGHGTTGAELVDRIAAEIRTWDAHHRSRTCWFELAPTGTEIPAADRFILGRPHQPVAISWH